MTAVPCAGVPTDVTVSGSPSASVSFARTSTSIEPSSGDRRRVVGCKRRVVHRRDRQLDGRRVRVRGSVVRLEGERIGAVVVRSRAVRAARARSGQGTVRGRRDDRVRERIAFHVGRRQRHDRRPVFCEHGRDRARDGCVVHRLDRDRDRRDVRVVDAVTRAEREGFRAVVVGRRGIRPARSGPGQRSVGRQADDRVRERVAVRVGRDEFHGKRCVLGRGLALRVGRRRGVVVRDRALALPVDDVPAGRIREVDDENLIELVESVAGHVDRERPAHDSRREVQSPRRGCEVDARDRRDPLRRVVDARGAVTGPAPRDGEHHLRRSGASLLPRWRRRSRSADCHRRRRPRSDLDHARAERRGRDEAVAEFPAGKRVRLQVGRRAWWSCRVCTREQDGRSEREHRQAEHRECLPYMESLRHTRKRRRQEAVQPPLKEWPQ